MATITSLSELDLNGTYSYADYMKWRFDDMVELIKGKVRLMSPAPNVKHQKISMNLSGHWYNYLKGKKCRVFTAPFDVRLYNKKKSLKADSAIFTVVQPDICVICDESKLDEQGCLGAPDLIIEILSLGNSKREMKEKYELYEEAGVKEYWVVSPYAQNITKFVMDNQGIYQYAGIYVNDDAISPSIFPELSIELNDIFES